MDNENKELETSGTSETQEQPKAETKAPAAPKSAKAPKATKAPAEPKEPDAPQVSDTLTKIGRELLKDHPTKQVIHMTSDGRGFFGRNDAENHARTLTDKTYQP